jgi:phosphoribosylaminoimidazole carboxylase (NCAIR synthetase)
VASDNVRVVSWGFDAGLVCIELFLVNKDGQQKILVNELAPRPHNSGQSV